MVRLERGKSRITGESLNFGAIELAKAYLESDANIGSSENRFSEKLKASDDPTALRRELTQLQTFLNSKSSTVKGMNEIERKRIRTFESGDWGNEFSPGKRRALKFASTKEFFDFLNSGTFRDLKSAGYTSEQIIEMHDESREQHPETYAKQMEKVEKALDGWRKKGQLTTKQIRKAFGLKTLK